MQRFIIKTLAITVIMLVIGSTIGFSHVYAETKSVYIPGAGWVGTAKTVGNHVSGATGTSSSTVTLYYIQAHIRIWHTGNVLQNEDNKEYNWRSIATTNTITSNGYGDYAATRHRHQYSSGQTRVSHFTSDYGLNSCVSAWIAYLATC